MGGARRLGRGGGRGGAESGGPRGRRPARPRAGAGAAAQAALGARGGQRLRAMGRRGVYVLRLRGQNGQPCFYVGSSEDIDRRVRQHKGQQKLPTGWRPIPFIREMGGIDEGGIDEGVEEPLERPPPDLGDETALVRWEEAEVYARMLKHGVNQVRGYEFVKTKLTVDDLATLQTNLIGRYSLCRRCGAVGHSKANCNAEKKLQWLEEVEDLILVQNTEVLMKARENSPKVARAPSVISALLTQQTADAQAPQDHDVEGKQSGQGQKRPRSAFSAGGSQQCAVENSAPRPPCPRRGRGNTPGNTETQQKKCAECKKNIRDTDNIPEKTHCFECWKKAQKCLGCKKVIPTDPRKPHCLECWKKSRAPASHGGRSGSSTSTRGGSSTAGRGRGTATRGRGGFPAWLRGKSSSAGRGRGSAKRG